MGDLILHIASRSDWERALAVGSYRADTLATEGFIHCSTVNQVDRVAEVTFKGVPGLVLLHIDAGWLSSEVRWEESGPGERFPHVYGPIEAAAVVAVEDFYR